MRRVLVLNNYPLDRVWQEVQLGETPDHHLFGINYFHERGYQPVIVPLRFGRWSRWQRRLDAMRLPLELGDVQQQQETFRRVKKHDLVYAPCATQTQCLQYLRAVGVFGTPIVSLVHHPYRHSRAELLRRPQRRLFVRGADQLPSLSEAVASGLRELGADGTRTRALKWGPDANYYQPRRTAGCGVVAAGRTGRDFATLATAARRADVPVVLIGLEGAFQADVFRGHGTLHVIEQPNEPPQPGRRIGWMKYPQLLEHLARARAIAIPLDLQENLCGITSLMDALGLGKPVIMTRNPHIDLDIEAAGIGRWIDPGDVDGWYEAIRWFDQHPAEAMAMGARARDLVDDGLNSKSFAHAIMDLFDRIPQ